MNKQHRNKIRICCWIILCGWLVSLQAQAGEKKQKPDVWYGKWPMLGLRVGTDIGAALPFPFKYIPSEFAPAIKPKLTFGGEVIVPVSKRFSVCVEVNYKTLAVDAEAYVEDQRFRHESLASDMYFTGMADMNMSFTMIEFPVYAEYAFSGGRNRLILGGYYSINKEQNFDVIAKKGFLRTEPDSEDLNPLSSDLEMTFSEELDSWDAGVTFGYERRIVENLSVNGKVHVGLKSIFTPDFDMLDYKMYQMRLAVGITYELVDFNRKYHLKKYIPSFKRKKKDRK